MLTTDEARAYQLDTNGIPLGIPNDNQLSYQRGTQVRLGKNRIDKGSIEGVEIYEKSTPKKPTKHKHGEYQNVLLTDAELEKLKAEYPDYLERIERLSEYIASSGKAYKCHYATIRAWARKDKEKAKPRGTGFSNAPERKQDFDDIQRRLIQAQNGGR